MTCDCNCTGLALDANGKVSTEHYCSCEFGSIRRMSANRKAIMAYRNAGSEPAGQAEHTEAQLAVINARAKTLAQQSARDAAKALDANDRHVLYAILFGLILGACATVIVLKLTGVIP